MGQVEVFRCGTGRGVQMWDSALLHCNVFECRRGRRALCDPVLCALTLGEVLLSVHLADGGAVVLQLTHPLIRLLKLVLQILLKNKVFQFIHEG